LQTARNIAIGLGRLFYLISQSVWNPNETVVIGRIVIKRNLCYSSYWQLSVCRMSDCVCSETERRFVAICFQLASVYGIREASAKQEGLEFNASKCAVGVALIYSHHRFVL
jgi:hypothetical protein